jgi:hypothetical protein
MTFAFACIGAAVAARVEDHRPRGQRGLVCLQDKGGKWCELPAYYIL